jgi:hypothetical protein
MPEDELRRQIAELVAGRADRATPPPIAAIRRRGRRRRARLAGVTAGVVLALLAGALGVDRLTSEPTPLAPAPTTTAPPTTRPVPAGPVVRVPAGGFEVPLPAGWTARKVEGPPADRGEAIIELVPRRAMSLNAAIVLQTQVLAPEQHPGLPRGEEPGVANPEGSFYSLDDRGSPLGRRRRPDGRPYVWRTRKLPDEVGEYAIAWPYHCHKAVACPPGNRWRVLVVHAGRSDDPTVRQKLRKVAQQVVNTVRPITNALPGGDPAHLDPALSSQSPTATTGIVQTTSAPVSSTAAPRP